MSLTSKLILGTVQFGLNYGINNQTGKPTFKSVSSILDKAREAGITTLDTARAYGDAMEQIGKYHRLNSFRFAVINKFHVKCQSFNLDSEIASSLDVLNISSMEGYLFHSFSDFHNNQHVLSDLVAEKEMGRIKKIGVSIYTNEEFISVLNSPVVDLIQLPFNLLDNNNLRGYLLRKAKENGLSIHVRSVFLQGLFFKELNELPSKLIELSPYLQKIKNIAEEAGVNVGQLALQYVLHNRNIDGVLIGVDNLAHLEENISWATELLDENVIKQIDRLLVKETHLLNPINWN